MFIQTIKQVVLDFFYPRVCPICNKIILPKGEKACPACKEKLTYILEPCCSKCGRQVIHAEQEYCYDCKKRNHHYKSGIALFAYDAYMQHSIIKFKYHHQKEFAVFYAEEIIKHLGRKILKISPDVLIPVPIHSRKRNQRGYNQAEILAKEIGRRISIPVLSELLIRKKNTIPQKSLTNKERIKNLEGAFCWNRRFLQINKKIPSRVLLIDDIYTTGSTMEACTKVLLERGIKEVFFLSLCIGGLDEGG